MTLSFAFGGDENTSYEELQRRRALGQLMMNRRNNGAPKTAIEGINRGAESILGALMAKKAGARADEERKKFGMLFDGALGGFAAPGGGGGFAAENPMDAAFPVGETGAAPERNTETVGGTTYDMGEPAGPAGWDQIQAGIFAGESGGDYDALFGYSNRPGGKFSHVKPTNMTVGEVLNFTNPSGEYGQTVKGQVGRVATPVGAYQIVGSTLRDAVNAGVVSPNAKFDRATQDRVGQWIYQTQGTGAWEGYRGPRSPSASARQPQGANPWLLSMMGDPRATDAQRSVLGMLLQQQMQQSDPMRQLQMQNLQSQIDARTQPQPGYQMLPPDVASEIGLPPGKAYQVASDGKISVIGGGGVTVNNMGSDAPQIGTIPQGFQLTQDPQTKAYSMTPIPGGPKDTTAQDAKAAEAKETSTNLVLDEIGIAKDLINGQTIFSPTTGLTGGLASRIDSTDAGSLKNRLTTIKANIGFDKLQAMRDASPTGGALGQVSEFENRLLQAVFGSLEQSQRGEDLLYNLERLETIYNRIIHEGIPEDEARKIYRDLALGNPADAPIPGQPVAPAQAAIIPSVPAGNDGLPPPPPGMDPEMWPGIFNSMPPEDQALFK